MLSYTQQFKPVRRVIIESPFAASSNALGIMNLEYAQSCARHSIHLNEAPFASHLFYTQFLRNKDDIEKMLGIRAGLCWGECAHLVAVYTDKGISEGMKKGVAEALLRGTPICYRSLEKGQYDLNKGWCKI